MFPEHFSYKTLEEFIGRKTILDQARGWLNDGKFHLAFFSGEYGIGKTRLLQRILEVEKKYDGAPARLIDLYHFDHHTPEGLARAVFKCFEKTENEHHFNPFITARRRLDEARAGGDSKAIHEWLQKLLDSCAEGVKKISAEHGVLLFFDTAEQFVYPTGKRFAPAWEWLKGWVGDLPRGGVFFAGRPAASALFQGFPLSTTIPLGFFTLEESNAYLTAVANRWSQETSQSVSFAEDEVQKLHALSQGRPILLAIFLESRMRDSQAFKNLSEYQTETFEQKVIEYLLNQPVLGETLKAAGRARKGINLELLVKICGMSQRDAKTALDTLKEMSFAKTFPDDERVYLHDDMYDLLEKYVYLEDADTAERQAAAQAIYEYYKEEAIEQKNKELQNIFASLAQEGSERSAAPSKEYVEEIRKIESSRQRLKTEFIHYRLRSQVTKDGKRKASEDDPILGGLKMYYRYGHEAATSNNDEILIPLQIELTNFWLTLNDENLWKLMGWLSLEDRNFWKPFIEGMLLVHEVWLKVATGQKYQDEVSTLQKSLSTISGLSSDQKTLLHALLETWQGTGLVFGEQQDYGRAEAIFSDIIDEIEKMAGEQRLTWFQNVILSLARRQRAYLYRIRGSFKNAIEDFRRGLNDCRLIHFDHEEATLRNDLGFAQMLDGQFLFAFENMWDGLNLRYKLAIGHRTALSHSSLAQYFIATGAYEEARKHAQSAIRIANAVGYRRGIGFGNLALAEATRRFAFSAQAPSNPAEYLREAQDAIEIALKEFTEPARVIEANLEQACLYRDRIRVETDPAKKKAWFETSDKQFKWVTNEAEKAGIEYRQVDAVSNRVWLGYFAKDAEYAEQAAEEFEQLSVLDPYWLKNGKFVDKAKARKNPQLWSHIGKHYVGRGMVALAKWRAEKNDEFLKEAAHCMMLGLKYTTAFAEDHRGLREGRRTLLLELAKLNSKELKQFCGYVLEAEKSEKIVNKNEQSTIQSVMRGHALWFAE
ncbi:MAG: ATP-binding protein [Anaerolineales bacterium]|nr:ATP-binding protein [Anaerolineales bacterium]